MNRDDRRRPSMALIAALLCSVTLGACMDESCNLTGPSETAASGRDIVSLEVEITYAAGAPSTALIANGRIGGVPFQVNRGHSTTIVVPVEKNQFVPTSIETSTGESCRWTGKKSLFRADAGYVITDDIHVAANGQAINVFFGRCAGW